MAWTLEKLKKIVGASAWQVKLTLWQAELATVKMWQNYKLHLQYAEAQKVRCKGTVEEVSFEWSQERISSTDSLWERKR